MDTEREIAHFSELSLETDIVFPVNIRQKFKLTSSHSLVYGLISTWSLNGARDIRVSNKELAMYFDNTISVRTIEIALRTLKRKGLIILKNPNGKNRTLTISDLR